MKQKILFYDRNMVIQVNQKLITHYYGELMYIKFEKPYCHLFFTGKNNYMVEIRLQTLIDNLPAAAFFKCKRSTIINLCYYKRFQKNPPIVVMADGKEIDLSKNNVPEFESRIESLPSLIPPCADCYTCPTADCENQALFCRRKKISHTIELERE